MNTVIDELPVEVRDVFSEIIGEHDEALLVALRTQNEPSQEQRLAVEDLLSDAFSDHLGPDGEPTERGRTIDDAIGAFLLRWPIEQ